MGWVSPKIETQDANRYLDIETAEMANRIYIEAYSIDTELYSITFEMTPAQARNLRDQINVALYTMGED